jgi:hypothetical protein
LAQHYRRDIPRKIEVIIKVLIITAHCTKKNIFTNTNHHWYIFKKISIIT